MGTNVREVDVLDSSLHVSGCRVSASPFQAESELFEALTAAGEKRNIRPGQRVFSFGEEAHGVFLLVKGTLRAALPGGAGQELVCRTVGAGSLLGVPSALCARNYQFDVEALEAAELVYLPTPAVNEILRPRPELCMKLMKMMCDELRTLRQRCDHMRSCAKRTCSMHESCTHEAQN